MKRILRFGLVGLSGVVVNEGILAFLTDIVGLHHLVSGVFSIEASILSNFILNDIWTFRDRRERSRIGRTLRFHVVAAGGALINYAGYWFLSESVGMHHLIAMPIAIMVGFIWNFTLSVLWAWRKPSRQSSQAGE